MTELKTLLKHNIDKEEPETKRFQSCCDDLKDIVDLVLSKCVRETSSGEDGNGVLVLSNKTCRSGHESSSRLCAECAVGVTNNRRLVRPMAEACKYGLERIIVDLLKEHGAPWNTNTRNGDKGLINACDKIVQLLKWYDDVDISVSGDLERRDLIDACLKKNENVLASIDHRLDDNNVRNEKRSNGFVKACTDRNEMGNGDSWTECGGNLDVIDNDERAFLVRLENIVKLLIEKLCTDVHVKVKECYPYASLVKACKYGCEGIVKLLVQCGAVVNMMEEDGVSASAALNGACRVLGCSRSLVDVLTERISDLNLNEDDDGIAVSVLIWACEYGYEQVVRLLMERGVDANVCKKDGDPVLVIACKNGHEDVVGVLLEDGCVDIDVVRDRRDESPLMVACRHGREKIVGLLIEHGVDLNACNGKGNTPLNIACENGHENVVKLLVEYGVDLKLKVGQSGSVTALMTACQNGHENIVSLLINNGADVNECDSTGKTALMLACQYGKNRNNFVRVVVLLIQHGTNIDAQDKAHKWTAVMMAVMTDNFKCLDKLLLASPNLDLTDSKGETVFSHAMKVRTTICLRLLLADGRLLNEGRLKPIHKNNMRNVYHKLEPLLVTIEVGVFEWEWCPFKHFQKVSLAALKGGLCPGKILNMSPLVLSFLANDVELIETFVRHLYYLPEDYKILSSQDNIRQRIKNKNLLEEFTRRPLSLRGWSCLTVSNSISLSGPPGHRHQKVESLPIPNVLKRELVFK